MPLTTPESHYDIYLDKKDHFHHVLECLFIPSIEKAGFKPIPPIAKGSELIHANIIQNLETTDIVLCDMSTLNPNVFFEFGIRTSLNKPISIVKDEHTRKIPFDTGIINYHEYHSSLESWIIQSEIDKLSKHIIDTEKKSKKENELWKYFGLKSAAKSYESENELDGKLDYLTMQIESLKTNLNNYIDNNDKHNIYKDENIDNVYHWLHKHSPSTMDFKSWSMDKSRVTVNYRGEITNKEAYIMNKTFHEIFGKKLLLISTGEPIS